MGQREGIKMRINDVPFQWTITKSNWINTTEFRLNASSYSVDAISVLRNIEELKKKCSVSLLGDFSDKIFYPPRFKRPYCKSGEGILFLSSREIFYLIFEGKYVKTLEDEYIVKPDWILITRSGTVGRVLLTNKLFDGIGVSEHVIRIIPDTNAPIGYLYAFLTSYFGQTLIKKHIFGGVVDEVEPNHIANIPVPLLPESDIKEINKKILKAHKLREEAQKLLLKAEQMIYTELGLPEIDEDDVKYFGGDLGRIVKSFIIKASELNLRLDTSYHLPILKEIDKYLLSSSHDVTDLGDVVQDVFIPTRFKRPYVNDPNIGIPFLQGSHIPLIKPFDIKYLWNKMKNLKKVIIKKNWILITRSGTVGRVAIVRDFWNGGGASEHVLRLIPNENINAGYLVAFLSSMYGELQMKGKVYGGVVDEIAEQDTSLIREIKILIPPDRLQEKIGNLVLEAYDKRDEANIIENDAVKLFEDRLRKMD